MSQNNIIDRQTKKHDFSYMLIRSACGLKIVQKKIENIIIYNILEYFEDGRNTQNNIIIQH
jgi:hypothetical protein